MKLFAKTGLLCLTLLGCNRANQIESYLPASTASLAESRILAKGVIRLSTTYSLSMNEFNSTCTATLIHSPDSSLNSCVAITAAHCFRHIPKSAQHTIEIIDGKGNISKTYRVSEVKIHPDFSATDAAQTVEQSAVDVAVMEFKCALPNGIQPSQVLDINQLPPGAKLTLANYERVPTENSQEKSFFEFDYFFKKTVEVLPVARLTQNSAQILSIDFQNLLSSTNESVKKGVLTLETLPPRNPCENASGAPAFYAHEKEVYLVATASSGIGFCDKSNLRYSVTSSHADWINKALDTQIIRPLEIQTTQQANIRITEPKKTPKPEFFDLDTLVVPSVASAASAQPTVKAAPTPTRVLPTIRPTNDRKNTQSTTSTKESKSLVKPVTAVPKTVRLSAKSVFAPPTPVAPPAPPETIETTETRPEAPEQSRRPAPTVSADPLVRPTVPPIPTAPADSTSENCSGIGLIARSKSRVWGTVIKLIDKETSQLSDASLKCDVPNESEICVVSYPIATGSGSSRTVLSQGISSEGCENFYSGRTIYLDPGDFQSRP